jgi:hypothetical protein
MPFCPSLLPCAKLTAVQVAISVARMPLGGGACVSAFAIERGVAQEALHYQQAAASRRRTRSAG